MSDVIKYIHSLDEEQTIRYLPGAATLDEPGALAHLAVGYETQDGARHYYNAVPVPLEEIQAQHIEKLRHVSDSQVNYLKSARTTWAGNLEKWETSKATNEPLPQPVYPAHYNHRVTKKDAEQGWQSYLEKNGKDSIVGFVNVPQMRSEQGKKLVDWVGPFPVRACDFIITVPQKEQTPLQKTPMREAFEEHGVRLQNTVRSEQHAL